MHAYIKSIVLSLLITPSLLLQVAVILAKMEVTGVGIDPRHLLGHKAALKQRMAVITARAQQLAGSPFNLASSSQIAKVLYDDLGLPAPTGTGGVRCLTGGFAVMHMCHCVASKRLLLIQLSRCCASVPDSVVVGHALQVFLLRQVCCAAEHVLHMQMGHCAASKGLLLLQLCDSNSYLYVARKSDSAVICSCVVSWLAEAGLLRCYCRTCAAGARGAAKTHLPTDEASLKQLQLATGHELPGLILEYRCAC
jgi:hypothetical protein